MTFTTTDDLNRVLVELRTPLTTILGFVGTLLREPDLPLDSRRSLLQIVRNEGMKMGALLDNLEELQDEGMRLSFMEVTVFELLNEVAELYRELHPAFSIEVEIEADAQTRFYDGELLKQIVLELLSNAMKFSMPKGNISIHFTETDDYIQIIIRDNGIGIPPEDLPHIGELFFRGSNPDRERDGIGLGLHLARKRAESLHGTLTIASVLNVGTAATLTLPKNHPQDEA